AGVRPLPACAPGSAEQRPAALPGGRRGDLPLQGLRRRSARKGRVWCLGAREETEMCSWEIASMEPPTRASIMTAHGGYRINLTPVVLRTDSMKFRSIRFSPQKIGR